MTNLIIKTTFLLLLLHSAYALPPIRFDVINTKTSAVLFPLTPNLTLSLSYPFALQAVPASPDVASITFTSPIFRVERRPPFTLPGDRMGLIRPLRLGFGRYVAIAYTDHNPADNLTVPFSIAPVGRPSKGPLPSEVQPVVPAGIDPVPIPRISNSCGRTTPPQPVIQPGSQFPLEASLWSIPVRVDWCPGRNSLRARIIRWEQVQQGGMTVVRTEVVKSLEEDFLQNLQILLAPRGCENYQVYLEFCGRRGGKVLCGTSGFDTVLKLPPLEPVLAFRPPLKVVLAPGDSVEIVGRITNTSSAVGFANGGDNENRTFALQGVAEEADGYFVKRTPLKITNEVRVRVGGEKGVGLRDNGRVVFVRYALRECLTSVGSWKERYPTIIEVSAAAKRLVKQDTKLPTIVGEPVYPVSVEGEAVVLSVEAVNNGGGMRAGGATTELQYQWYIRNELFQSFASSYAEPILGETGPTLSLTAMCSGTACGRSGCANLQIYSVDVCNTFGCTRSQPLQPRVTRTQLAPGELFDRRTCLGPFAEYA